MRSEEEEKTRMIGVGNAHPLSKREAAHKIRDIVHTNAGTYYSVIVQSQSV